MGIYRDIGIHEVAKFVAAIAGSITIIICYFLFPIFLRNGNDAVCMAIIIGFVVFAITYIVFANHEFNRVPEHELGETNNKHVSRKNRKSK